MESGMRMAISQQDELVLVICSIATCRASLRGVHACAQALHAPWTLRSSDGECSPSQATSSVRICCPASLRPPRQHAPVNVAAATYPPPPPHASVGSPVLIVLSKLQCSSVAAQSWRQSQPHEDDVRACLLQQTQSIQSERHCRRQTHRSTLGIRFLHRQRYSLRIVELAAFQEVPRSEHQTKMPRS